MKFSVFGDLHYSSNLRREPKFEENREVYFDHYMQELFMQNADYYISIGDLTNTGAKEEYQGVYNIINKYDKDNKFIHTIGNHDMYVPTKEDVRAWINQPLTQVIVEDDICMIFLDSTREQNVFNWSGYIDDAQLAWLDQTLQANSDKTVVIFCHHPVYNTTLFSEMDKASIVPEVPINEVLAKHKKEAFFICGHVHADSIVQKDNWTFVQIAAVIDQPNIRNIEITSHSFSIESVDISEEYRQIGTWMGARMNHFGLLDRGYQGKENREIALTF